MRRNFFGFTAFAALTFLLIFFLAGASQALTMKKLNLEELVDSSDLIFYGQVRKVVEGRSQSGKAPAILTHFQVLDSWKGGVTGEVFVMRQAARSGPGGRLKLLLHGEKFRVGERVLVFAGNSSSLGFSGPIGFGQGIFRTLLRSKENGEPLLLNGFRNQGLFQRLQSAAILNRLKPFNEKPSARNMKPIALTSLKDMVLAHRGVGK